MIARDNSLWQPREPANLTWQQAVPTSTACGDVYYSTDNGVAESRYVFLEGTGIQSRFGQGSAVIAETGFGTGLNFLVTLTAWLAQRDPERQDYKLHYLGFESHPLNREQLLRAWAPWRFASDLTRRLEADWPAPVAGCHRLCWHDWGVILDLWWEDATEALGDIASRGTTCIDAWYLDGFAPAKDPSLWSAAIFGHMARLSNPGTRFATFTAAGSVRRGLADAGFAVTKRPGFGRKREALAGEFLGQGTPNRTTQQTPWDISPKIFQPCEALVLGAGLAGCFAARALADRGYRVQVLDQASVANGGSSNLQGLTYARPSRRHSALTDFSLLSFMAAVRCYANLFQHGRLQPDDGAQCGYLQLSEDQETLDYLTHFNHRDLPFVALSALEASEVLALTTERPALNFPDAFWLNPKAVCLERLDHPLISLHDQAGTCTYKSAPEGWAVTTKTRGVFKAPLLVVATAQHASQHAMVSWLPLQTIRGQTTHIEASESSNALPTALCHQGYFPPPRRGIHCFGASYGPGDAGMEERPEEHRDNLRKLADALPALNLVTPAGTHRGHVAHRCNSRDYLPIVGAVPDRAAFNDTYRGLSGRKTYLIDAPCPVVPGLYVMTALGSRGLSAAPLAAEILASEITGEILPVARHLHQALVPARFLKRALVRGTPL